MNTEELARTLYSKASDMDFADYMDTEEETISSITEELEKCPVLRQILDIINISER